MFQVHYGPCIDCPPGTISLIVVKSGRCHFHNEQYKQSNKSPARLERERIKREEKAARRKKTIKRLRSKPKKVTNEKSVFEHIWATRLHRCEVCGRPLIRKPNSVSVFSHVLSKGASTHTRLDEHMILLMGDGYKGNCTHHRQWEERTEEMRNIEMWKPVFLLLDAAKKSSHDTRKNKPLYAAPR